MSKYEKYSPDRIDELQSNYLFDSWSQSKVKAFARNEKGFEMQYIYCEESRNSSVSVAGNAYHLPLEHFFKAIMKSKSLDIVDLTKIGMDYIAARPANTWKLQKTTPTIDKCVEVATKATVVLIQNFFKEMSIYMDELAEVIAVELYCNEWLTINGVDIPMPCHAYVDLIIRLKDGRIIIIDHKSTKSFTDAKDAAFDFGKQGVTYAKCVEKKLGIIVDEVWFIENKYSKNKDGSAQLKRHEIILNKDTRKLLEYRLYENLKRMLEAISDPDYVYLINESDNFIGKAEINEFWAKTMIAEIDSFNIPDNKVELIEKRIKKIRDASVGSISPKVISTFKDKAASFITYDLSNKNMTPAEKIEQVLFRFGIVIKVEHTFEGHSSDTFLLAVQAGTKISTIERYKLDIASGLSVQDIRIGKNLVVNEGRSFLAIEAIKQNKTILHFDEKELIDGKIPLGKDNFNNTIHWDINNPSTPHVLIGGATGAGKTACIISTIEYLKLTGIKKIYLVDPKRIDFNMYKNDPVIEIYQTIEDIEAIMACLVDEMNARPDSNNTEITPIIFDEMSDAFSKARKGAQLKVYEDVETGQYKDGRVKTKRTHVSTERSLQENLLSLAQTGRACGIRLVVGTQRTSAQVLNGDIKVNFPVQVAFRVPREIDSKVLIDEAGAECLGGKGDALIKSPEYLNTTRFQGFFKQN